MYDVTIKLEAVREDVCTTSLPGDCTTIRYASNE
jgi:hypothetical protein